jgi:hypothetical protein
VARQESFLRWETQAVSLEPAWVHLSGLAAADFLAARIVRIEGHAPLVAGSTCRTISVPPC